MHIEGRVVVVTGGAHGIGAALCRKFVAAKAAAVWIADLDLASAEFLASTLGPTAYARKCDVTQEADLEGLTQAVIEQHGRIDIFFSNAGIAVGGGPEAPDTDWQRAWDVNVMAHVKATRLVLPAMLARGEGYLLSTASAAGLLTSLGAAPYAATKHAAVAYAEWLSITYGARGIRVSCLCPQGVRTSMIDSNLDDVATKAVLASGPVIEADECAAATLAAMEKEQFLILPHPQVADYEQHRAGDRERWLGGMRKLWAKVERG